MNIPDFYAFLGVPRFYATQDEIRAAYLAQVRYFHPDANHVPPDVAKERTQLLNTIYATLSDSAKKRAYDEQLANFLIEQQNSPRYNAPTQRKYEPAPASQQKRGRVGIIVAISLILCLFLVLACLLLALFSDSSNPALSEPEVTTNNVQTTTSTPSPAFTPMPTPTPIPTLKPAIPPPNGTIKYPSGGYSEDGSGYLTIEASSDEHYFIKLKDARTGELVLSFFVCAGQTAEVNVPFGEYTLSYACGKEWYGYTALFGDDTAYSAAEDTFLFEDYGDSVTWWTVELYLQYNGNLDTYAIDPDEF